ncbi:ASCH domain-containing protein [Archaeoglobus veneficus]|uniref:ASCH domain protein n=1 Tax=Archaeoglobus veneficus (strain DSM 11195 / SNP6) TaxID=693661 RepID=F2KPF9_ARCVS|nr:ASCH domain-containing protein [Archaeoglobus veneficus]AEA46390.1 ASCH domain protein [Archaeoglobus veneficus SNP6]
MTAINFDKEYVPLILEGKKRTTVRKGIKSYPVGKVVYLTANNEPFARARVVKAVIKRVRELTDEDAIKDGFDSVEELIKALKRIYGSLRDDEFVTVVHFELV